ncbi:MAG: hypothetical protein KME14_26645 [Tildeniella torsiva UHER 1998/13D]|jgi:hypothetical protein|nr:hypothetical protein [Tildeniella torsiva UHER 1998/13D]
MSNLVTSHPLWIDTAEDAAEGMHNPKLYIGGGLAGGLVLGSLLNPLTGLAALSYGLYMAWDANERNSDQIEAVSEGLIAHLLDKKQLRKYQAEVGADQVQSELTQAIARELRLSDDAETLARSLGLLGKPKALPPADTGSSMAAQPTEHAQGDMTTTPPIGTATDGDDGGRRSQPAIAIGSSAPWDDEENGCDDTATDADDKNATVIDDRRTIFDDKSPYGLDKLRGVSMRQFKDQLTRLGITAESGSFKSVELLKYPGASTIVEQRLRSFWKEFGSARIPHAVYFVFGLQSGGNRSETFKQQYEEAKLWVTNWFKENLPHE